MRVAANKLYQSLELAEGNIEPISPDYVSRILNVPLKDVEICMKELGN